MHVAMHIRGSLISHEKGKPVARQGRKAVSLLFWNLAGSTCYKKTRDCLVAEGNRRSCIMPLAVLLGIRSASLASCLRLGRLLTSPSLAS